MIQTIFCIIYTISFLMSQKFNPQDHYFKQAKKDGFVARSAYKLEEIDKKFTLF